MQRRQEPARIEHLLVSHDSAALPAALDHPIPPPLRRELLTAVDVTELLSVPVSWVRELSRRGRIPPVQLGHYVRYRRETVVSWSAQQEAGAFRRARPQIPA